MATKIENGRGRYYYQDAAHREQARRRRRQPDCAGAGLRLQTLQGWGTQTSEHAHKWHPSLVKTTPSYPFFILLPAFGYILLGRS